jgi:hypothetical protein
MDMNLPSHFGFGFAYFFSSYKNISSIVEHGHLSRGEVVSNPDIVWDDIAPRKDHLDIRKKIELFISLYFGTHTATQFRHEQDDTKIAFIRYDADELFQRERAWFTEIAYQMATKSQIWRCRVGSEKLEKLGWGLINSQRGFRSKGPNSDEWAKAQAELLVDEKIEPSKILDIVFCSQQEKNDYLNHFGAPFNEFDEPINCIVNEELFIKTKCRKCDSIGNITIQDYKRQWCADCEHYVDFFGRYGRYRQK